MDFQLILLAILAAYLVYDIVQAMTRPMLRNVLRMLCVPVAFIITFVLQALGVFQGFIEWAVDKGLALAGGLPEQLSMLSGAINFLTAYVSTIISPLFFTLVFGILLFVLRAVHVNLLAGYIESRQEKKAKRELKEKVKAERARVKDIMKANTKDSEKMAEEISEKIYEKYPDVSIEPSVETIIYTTYEGPDKDDIEDMVDHRIRKEKRRLRRKGFFKESPENKAISMVSACVSAFLAVGIILMPTFYLMNNVSAITDGIQNTDANDVATYRVIDVIDEHIVEPYENSFVYQLYSSLGIVDLMNATTRLGGQLVMDTGKVYYADDVIRNLLTRAVRVACEVTSGKSEHNNLADDIDALTNEPVVVNMLADIIIDLMEDVEIPEEAEGEDILAAFVPQFISHYKNADKATIVSDLGAISDMIVVLVEHDLISDLISDSFSPESLLTDRELLGDTFGAMSMLSPFPSLMDGIFSMGTGMIGPMLGAPADNAAGFDHFINSLASAPAGFQNMTAEEVDSFYALMMEASKFNSLFDYVCDPIEREGGLRDLKEHGDKLKELGEKLKTRAEEIKADGEALAQRAEELEAEATGLESRAEELKSEAEQVEQEFENFKNNPPLDLSAEEYEAKIKEFEDKITDLENQGKELEAEAEELTAEGELLKEEAEDLESQAAELQTQGEKLAEDAEHLTEILESLTTELQDRASQLTLFVSYYMSWTSMQKPFMIANEDVSTACLSISVGDKVYVCNTDELSLMDLVSAMQGTVTVDGFDITEEDITNGDIDIDFDEIIDQIPMKDLLKKLSMTSNTEEYDGRISPVADLINYFIIVAVTDEESETSVFDAAWVIDTLASFDDGKENSVSDALVDKLLAVTEENKVEFEYHGVTVEKMNAALNFYDEEWVGEVRKRDAANLVSIIFDLMDMMESMGGMPMMADDTETGSEEAPEMDAIIGLLKVFGSIMDSMAETECLKELPPIMLEAILKNDMLGMAMTPSLYSDLMGDMETNPDKTYEQLMTEIADMVSELMDSMNSTGGESQ